MLLRMFFKAGITLDDCLLNRVSFPACERGRCDGIENEPIGVVSLSSRQVVCDLDIHRLSISHTVVDVRCGLHPPRVVVFDATPPWLASAQSSVHWKRRNDFSGLSELNPGRFVVRRVARRLEQQGETQNGCLPARPTSFDKNVLPH